MKIDMYHPKTGQTATVSVRAFELVWSKNGWRISSPEPAPDPAQPEPDQPPVDDPELED